MKLIDKAAVVAGIDDWRSKIKKGIFSIPLSGKEKAYATFEYEVLGKVISFLDSLEVKNLEESKNQEWSEEDELSCFESALFTAFSDAWQQYLRGKEVDIAQWAKEHSKELLEAAKEDSRYNGSWRN